MKVVGVRELKSRLSEYLRSVREGERVIVTDRGEPVAALVPPDDADVRSLDPRLAALVRKGLARPGAANRPELYPRMKHVLGRSGLTAAQLLDEDRGEG
jgi:prevent-host-death family protein